MDIFSTIASAIDLAEKLKTYIQDIQDESSERKNLLDEVTALTTLLPLLSARIENAKRSPDKDYQDAIVALGVKNGPLDQFIESLTTLNGKLERAEKGTVKRAVQKLLWPFTLREIKDKLGQIERFKSLVAFILAFQSPILSQTRGMFSVSSISCTAQSFAQKILPTGLRLSPPPLLPRPQPAVRVNGTSNLMSLLTGKMATTEFSTALAMVRFRCLLQYDEQRSSDPYSWCWKNHADVSYPLFFYFH